MHLECLQSKEVAPLLVSMSAQSKSMNGLVQLHKRKE